MVSLRAELESVVSNPKPYAPNCHVISCDYVPKAALVKGDKDAKYGRECAVQECTLIFALYPKSRD